MNYHHIKHFLIALAVLFYILYINSFLKENLSYILNINKRVLEFPFFLFHKFFPFHPVKGLLTFSLHFSYKTSKDGQAQTSLIIAPRTTSKKKMMSELGHLWRFCVVKNDIASDTTLTFHNKIACM